MTDLTGIYYTSNQNSDYFMANTQRILLENFGDNPIISVSFKPTVIGNNCTNIVIGEQQRSNYMLYKQVLIGVRAATTKYVCMLEDDMLYSKEHFQYRPEDGIFAYNTNKWSIFSWKKPPIFSQRIRKLMNSLIVTREALLKTLEERYSKYPVLEEVPGRLIKYFWGEPGRFEDHLGINKLKTEEYYSSVPNIMFSTSEALGYLHLGERKKHSGVIKTEVEHWGSAEAVLKLYAKVQNERANSFKK